MGYTNIRIVNLYTFNTQENNVEVVVELMTAIAKIWRIPTTSTHGLMKTNHGLMKINKLKRKI